MFNMGGGELIVIALIALLVIKPDKLPGLATSLGRWVGELKRSLNDVKRAVSEEYTRELRTPLNLDKRDQSVIKQVDDKAHPLDLSETKASEPKT